jgi:hypothetical protein
MLQTIVIFIGFLLYLGGSMCLHVDNRREWLGVHFMGYLLLPIWPLIHAVETWQKNRLASSAVFVGAAMILIGFAL